MQITVTESIQQRIDALMATGDFTSVPELLAAALDALSDPQEESEEYLAYLRREVQIGLDDIKHGRVEPLDMNQILNECHAEYEGRSK